MAPEAPTRSGWQKGPLLHHSSPPQTSLGILFVSLSCCGAPRFLQGQLRNVPSEHKHTQGVSLPLLVSYYCNSWCKRMSCSCVKAAQNVNTCGVWRLGATALVRTLLLIENKTQWPCQIFRKWFLHSKTKRVPKHKKEPFTKQETDCLQSFYHLFLKIFKPNPAKQWEPPLREEEQ